ncbi:MAG: ABC transporter permease [Armatimonadota bacterium]|nr:ABC transporter permease [Armatimonadota bacterium]MCX7777964.1 ABC transporter permease [Armatimonadota bacterium]MDW8025279.1 ABC transporter permease [Armatimonadota bacterium]
MRERILLVLIAIMICVNILIERSINPLGLLEMTRHFLEVWLLALPMTLLIISGGIDLSVGSMVGLGVVTIGISWGDLKLNIWSGVILTIIVGTFSGMLNGAVVAYIRVPPLIVTLATMAVYRGLAYGFSQAKPYSGFPSSFEIIGQGYILGIPTQLIIFAILALLTSFIASKTVWGRYVYAIGQNETAARFSGIPVEAIKLCLYTYSGFCAALAALILVSRTNTARADAGLGYELDVIASVLLGGASISGGEGSILGTVLGLIVIALVRRALTLQLVRTEGQTMVIGALLIASVVADQLLRRREKR